MSLTSFGTGRSLAHCRDSSAGGRDRATSLVRAGRTGPCRATLFQIAPAPFRAAADSALANLQRAQATYTLAKTQTERLRPLAAADAVSKQTFDNAVAQRDQSAAEVAQARAELAQRRLDVGFARITSRSRASSEPPWSPRADWSARRTPIHSPPFSRSTKFTLTFASPLTASTRCARP
jgi:hypothetical protein